MSKICTVCGRGPSIAISSSHSQVKTKRWRDINLQSKKIDGKAERVCTKCIKTMAK